MPLFARPGRIIAFGSVDERPDYAYAEGVTFRVYALADGAEATASVPDMRGKTAATVSVRRKGRVVEAELEGSAKGWSVPTSLLAAISDTRIVPGSMARATSCGCTWP